MEGTAATTFGNLGYVLVIGTNLLSESDPSRKQVSGRRKLVRLVICHGEKTAAHCLVTFLTYQLDIVTLTEAGLAYKNVFNSFDQDSFYTALKLSSKPLNRIK